MAVIAEALSYVSLINIYKLVWRKNLAKEFSQYESRLYKLAEGLGQVGLDDQIFSCNLDLLLPIIFNGLSETAIEELLNIVEHYCDFLISRGYLNINPFRYAAQSAINESPPKTVEGSTLDKIRPLIVPPEIEIESSCIVNETTAIIETPKPSQNSMSLDEIISKFFEYRTTQGRKIYNGTIPSYQEHFQHFKDFLLENNLPLIIDSDTLQKYVRHLESYLQPDGNPYSGNTKSLKKYSLRSLITFAKSQGFLEISEQYKDILFSEKRERTPKNRHRAITVEEADKLIQCVSILPNLKSKLEVLIPLLTGPRGSEIILIQPQNFDFTTNKLHLTLTKNGLPRDIPIPYFLIPMIQAYLKTYDFRTGEYIFPGQGSKHETVRTLREHIEKCVQLSGIKRKVTPHDLRATYATYQSYYGGLHIKALQKYLGHESYETSMKYVADEFETSDCKLNLKDLYVKWAEMLTSSCGDGTINM
ncbi:tyrosine-type recombinase/integrase [Desulfosporosinus lacus]|uniref:Site-specific recombinase XerD n=1 Tax=Desulfosporosinus lacus DSM 15449 TaxID=1121420 RepID=A0A1M5V640_9FIRM|nr:tyrosine-type recombinase/integrase [Desulfosporosinus lacus]SHH70732.1 Site-specific recombinase XerD [Desulfosporosinus lacus DSM 15449]